MHHWSVAMNCSMLWCDREESSLIGEMQRNVLRECCFGLKVKVVRGTRQTKWPAASGIAEASNRGVEFRLRQRRSPPSAVPPSSEGLSKVKVIDLMIKCYLYRHHTISKCQKTSHIKSSRSWIIGRKSLSMDISIEKTKDGPRAGFWVVCSYFSLTSIQGNLECNGVRRI